MSTSTNTTSSIGTTEHGYQTPGTALSFTISIVRTEQALAEACAIRAEAYGRHNPGLGIALAEPDPVDRLPGTLVLIARDKKSGKPIATARIKCNRQSPLQIESAIELPPNMRGQHLAEVTRFASTDDCDWFAPLALIKACYLFSYATQVRWVIIGARGKLVSRYRAVGFTDFFADKAPVPLPYTGGLEHQVLLMDILQAERIWSESKNPMYSFMGETFHPDIQIFSSVASSWTTPRLVEQRVANG